MKQPLCCSRRHFVQASGFGIGSLALACLLRNDGVLADPPVKPVVDGPIRYDLLPRKPHFEAKAKAMISIFMMGGPSQMDMFDPKPMLTKYDGQKFPEDIKYDNVAQSSSKVFGSPWKFSPRGQCGMELSELVTNLGEVADDITLIRSMQSGVNNHLQGMLAINNGRSVGGRPSLGAWLTYGLGSESQELPAYLVLTHPNGLPIFSDEQYTNGFLPSLYQGTVIRPGEPRILNLDPPAALAGIAQRRQLDLLKSLNEEHLAEHPGEFDLQARISSYTLAAKMQTSAKEALDLSNEPESIKKMYGYDDPKTKDYASRCIIARRLIERGVRFVQIINNGQSWDHHSSLFSALPANCVAMDKPCAALIKDLKQRGLLDSTVVHWGGEMGRLPVLQNDVGRDKCGRDHNTFGFSHWVAGGGFKRGHVHGATDEWGHRAVRDVVHHYDWHATLLHCFGFEHTNLTYLRNGTATSLTDGQDARVVKEILL